MRDTLKWIALGSIFAVPFTALVVANSHFFPFITGKNFLFRFLVEVAFVSWALLALYDAQYRPRFSWLLVSLGAFVGIMAAADAFGVNPLKSFWSNFERMEGWVTLAHLFLYVVTAASVLNTRALWDKFFNTMLAAATIMLMVTFAQLAGLMEISQGGVRVDGRLGNAAYNAIYMLFHAFIAALMFMRTRSQGLRVMYGVLIAAFAFILVRTATRGAILGLIGGVTVSALYIVLFGRAYAQARKGAIAALGLVVALVIGFIAVKDTSYVREHPIFGRVATISLEAGETRFAIWGMALEGFKERPILGWGQENFNYVFNKYYEPSLYAQEPWFDRVHNIFFDWLIAGGILGFLGYFSVFGLALYYAVVRPWWQKSEEQFTVAEQGILLGLFAGYLIHNIFVFDNIVSYMLYGSMLAFIHARVGREVPALMRRTIHPSTVTQVAVPIGATVLALAVYFVNVPGLLASSDLITAFRAPTAEARLEAFNSALDRNSFGNQEIREQLTRTAQQLARDARIPQETRAAFLSRAEEEMNKQIAETPNDARIRVFAGSFYRNANMPERALEHYEVARAASPQKQQILFEIALSHFALGDKEKALQIFKETYELEPRFTDARMFYAGMALYQDNVPLFNELVTEEYETAYLRNDFILRAAYDTRQYSRVIEMLGERVRQNPQDLQMRVSLAVAYNDTGDTNRAIATLEQAIKDFPDFKKQGEEYIKSLREGKTPGQ